MRRQIRSERVKLPNVHRVTRRGKVYKYHRITRAELPSDVPEDHPRFIAAWTAQQGKQRDRKLPQDTVAGACQSFLASGEFLGMSASYGPVIRRHIEAIARQGEDARVADLQSSHVEADLDPLTPAVARSRLKAWRRLGAFWKRHGIVKEDFTRTVTGKRMPRTDGHREWSRADVEAFRACWPLGTPQRLAMELLQWTGARCVDAVRLGPGMIDRDGLLVFRQSKTGAETLVPWTAPSEGFDAERAFLLSEVEGCRHMVFMTTEFGRPRSHKAFSQWFSGAATKAGLPGLSAHGLRKYRMNTLAEGGANVLKMQTWVGHLTLDEVERYTKKANRRRAMLGRDSVNSEPKAVKQ